MQGTYSTEEWLDFQHTARRCNPEDKARHDHRCEKLRSYEPQQIYAYVLLFQH
jgi:hypothetical protein